MNNKAGFADRLVTLEGLVERWLVKGEPDKAGSFILKDFFGDTIQIRALPPLPPIGQHVQVQGLFTVDSGGVSLQALTLHILVNSSQRKKSHIGDSILPLWAKITGIPVSPQGILAGLGLALLLGIILGVLVLLLKGEKRPPLYGEGPTDLLEKGKTIHIDLKSQVLTFPEVGETTKEILPGFFEISKGLASAKGQKIFIPGRFTQIGREEPEVDKTQGWITFPAEYATVSRHQADLKYEGGKYYLTNFAYVNPTTVNDLRLKVGEKIRLEPGDRITFGMIDLTYRSLS
jgi:hypothetical protein